MDTGKVPGEIGNIPEFREVTETPREVYGPYWALVEGREKEQGRGRPPQAQSELGGGPAPPFLLSSPLFLPSPTPNRKGGAKPTWSRIAPPRARHPLGRPPPPSLLYIRGQGGTPETQQLIIDLLAVCGAPLHHNPPR